MSREDRAPHRLHLLIFLAAILTTLTKRLLMHTQEHRLVASHSLVRLFSRSPDGLIRNFLIGLDVQKQLAFLPSTIVVSSPSQLLYMLA